MEDFELSSRLEIGNGEVRVKFRSLESGIEELEPLSDAWNREWKSSSQVRRLEKEMKEIEPRSDSWNWELKSSSQLRGLEWETNSFISDSKP